MNELKMNQQDAVEKEMNEKASEQRNTVIAGLMLIGIGLVVLVGQMVDVNWAGMMIPGLLGVLFMLWGVLSRSSGLIIPGGILSGIGLGILLIANPAFTLFSGFDEGGIFMLAFAAGWVSITVMTALFGEETHWWALIPGGIMALIGGAILFGGVLMAGLAFLGKIWPVFLILAGIALIARRSKTA